MTTRAFVVGRKHGRHPTIARHDADPYRAHRACLALITVSPHAQSPADKWDITTPTSTVSFETIGGTWMNVDVSLDGRRVVFDLLGDLYTMPIEGSRRASPATRITSGVAFDMQPRFSPDGKSIAFISDRGGLFNVWLADADGQHARQIRDPQGLGSND